MTKKQKRMLRRILIAAALMILLHFAFDLLQDKVHEPIWFFLYLIPYLVVGYDICARPSTASATDRSSTRTS